MKSSLLSFQELKTWFGCKQDGDVVRKLKENNIPYHIGINGKPVTTIDAVNAGLIKTGKAVTNSEIRFG